MKQVHFTNFYSGIVCYCKIAFKILSLSGLTVTVVSGRYPPLPVIPKQSSGITLCCGYTSSRLCILMISQRVYAFHALPDSLLLKTARNGGYYIRGSKNPLRHWIPHYIRVLWWGLSKGQMCETLGQATNLTYPTGRRGAEGV